MTLLDNNIEVFLQFKLEFLHAVSTKFCRESKKSGDLMRSRTRENNVYVEEE